MVSEVKKKRLKSHLRTVILYLCIIMFGLSTLLPVFWTFRISVSTFKDIFFKQLFISKMTLDNYFDFFDTSTFKGRTFLRAYKNSIILAFSSTGLILLVASFASYAFSRLEFRWRKKLFLMTLSSRFLPPVMIVLPIYLLFTRLKLIDNLLGMILLYAAMWLPYSIWLLKGYMDSIPVELDEAAMIDGCSRFGAFLRVTLPLAAPGLVVVAVFLLIDIWNEFLFNLVLTGPHAMNLQVRLAQMQATKKIWFADLTAGSLLATIPMIAFVLAFQRYIVKGLTRGALKF